MNYVDIAVLGIIALFVIIGFARGFLSTAVSLAATLLSLAAAFLLAKTLANIIGGIGGIKDLLGNLVGGLFKGDMFTAEIDLASNAAAAASLMTLGLPEILAKALAPAVIAAAPASGEPLSIAGFLGPMIVKVILVVGSFFLIFFVVRLIMKLVEKFIKGVLLNRTLRTGDRILGGAFGLIKSYFALCIMIIILELLVPAVPALASIQNMLNEGNLSSTLTDHNIIKKLFEKINIADIINAL